MVVLSRDSEERDVLQSLAAQRRELHLRIHTGEALRDHRSRRQRLHLAPAFARARQQLAAQVRAQRRVAFRGPVAVELSLSLAEDSDQTQLPRLLKSYVDLLKRHVLPDDSVIDHLMVSLDRRSPVGACADYRVLPLDLFAADWDRAFRLVGPRLGSADEWGLKPFTEIDREMLRDDERVLRIAEMLDDQEDEQLAEDPDGYVDLDIPTSFEEFADWEVRASVRQQFEPRSREPGGTGSPTTHSTRVTVPAHRLRGWKRSRRWMSPTSNGPPPAHPGK